VPLAHAGLALATSLAALLNAGLLYRGLRRAGVHRPRPGWGAFAGQVAGAATLMAVVVVVLAPPAPEWTAAGLAERATRLVGLVGAGAGAYALGLALLGMRPRSLRPPPVV
jgi:putative peptidoglycan lipid II flippase